MKMKLIMENFKANMGLTKSSKIKEIDFGGDDEDRRNWDNEKPAIIDALNSELEELGMDWIIDDIMGDLAELGVKSNHADEFKQKIKNYLNSKADDFAYPNLGDEVFGGDQVSTG